MTRILIDWPCIRSSKFACQNFVRLGKFKGCCAENSGYTTNSEQWKARWWMMWDINEASRFNSFFQGRDIFAQNGFRRFPSYMQIHVWNIGGTELYFESFFLPVEAWHFWLRICCFTLNTGYTGSVLMCHFWSMKWLTKFPVNFITTFLQLKSLGFVDFRWMNLPTKSKRPSEISSAAALFCLGGISSKISFRSFILEQFFFFLTNCFFFHILQPQLSHLNLFRKFLTNPFNVLEFRSTCWTWENWMSLRFWTRLRMRMRLGPEAHLNMSALLHQRRNQWTKTSGEHLNPLKSPNKNITGKFGNSFWPPRSWSWLLKTLVSDFQMNFVLTFQHP